MNKQKQFSNIKIELLNEIFRSKKYKNPSIVTEGRDEVYSIMNGRFFIFKKSFLLEKVNLL